MAEAPLTLTALLDELDRRGLRVSSVVMEGPHVASFTAVPAENVTAPAAPRAEERAEEEAPEPNEALERFVNRKGLRK